MRSFRLKSSFVVGFEAEELRECLDFLEARKFPLTERLPLVASRQWTWAWEREAWSRFRNRLPNLHEVAWPRLLWNRASRQEREAFLALSLGQASQAWACLPELKPLYQGGSRPRWTVLVRFGRYVLRSHPEDSGESFVYFGDDTLFLMARSRELLGELSQKVSSPKCLDLCCGGGGVSLALPSFPGEVLGVDLNATAVELANKAAEAQNLPNYSYRVGDVNQSLEGSYDLVFGNPPTLSPQLTGQDVFHATGTWEAFQSLLERVVATLSKPGRAVLTLFSTTQDGEDPALSALRECLEGRRGFRYTVRREYPLGSGRTLRHCALELLPEGESEEDYRPPQAGWNLPGIAWRRR